MEGSSKETVEGSSSDAIAPEVAGPEHSSSELGLEMWSVDPHRPCAPLLPQMQLRGYFQGDPRYYFPGVMAPCAVPWQPSVRHHHQFMGPWAVPWQLSVRDHHQLMASPGDGDLPLTREEMAALARRPMSQNEKDAVAAL